MFIRTLHITNHYHQNSGGIRTSLQAMLETAEQTETPISVLAPSSDDRVELLGKFGRIYHVRALRSPILDRRYRLLTPGRIYSSKGALWRIIEAEKPDLICVSDKYLLPYLGGLIRKSWAPISFRPTVIGMNCERLDDNVRAHMPWMPFWRKFCRFYLGSLYIPQFDAHIANSVYTAAELTESMKVKHQRRVEIAPLGVDVDTFRPQLRSAENRKSLCNDLKLPQHAKLLAYAGRLSPEKNPMLLLRTMEKLKDWQDIEFRLLIVGSGPSRGWMEKRAQNKIDGKVVFLDHIPNRQRLATLLANCDAFLHPNPREPFGIGPLEAMASGLPAVLPNQGGVLTYAGWQNSWLADPHAEGFSQAVMNIFQDPNKRELRMAAARKTAEQFSWTQASQRLFQCFEQLHARRLEGASDSPPSGAFSADVAARFGALLLSALFRFNRKIESRYSEMN